jgi:hypothetical protein
VQAGQSVRFQLHIRLMDIDPHLPMTGSNILDRRVAPMGGKPVGVAGLLRALWRKCVTRGGDMSAPDSVNDLSEHMLVDIGINGRLPSHCVAQQIAEHRRGILTRVCTPHLVVALIAAATLDAAGAADSFPVARSRAAEQIAGVPTGEEVNGTPVYRLPPMVVVGRSNVARAGESHGKQAARTQHVRAKAVARSPV